MTKVLTNRFHLKGQACDIDVYKQTGGYQAFAESSERIQTGSSH
jgi:hypothetical protein